jgi:hypothetical protein
MPGFRDSKESYGRKRSLTNSHTSTYEIELEFSLYLYSINRARAEPVVRNSIEKSRVQIPSGPSLTLLRTPVGVIGYSQPPIRVVLDLRHLPSDKDSLPEEVFVMADCLLRVRLLA